MKIGIDLKPFYTGSKYRGIGTYSREFIKNLIQMENDFEYHFLNLYGEYESDPLMNDRCIMHNYYNGIKIVDVGERQLFRDKKLDNYREAQVKHFLQKSDIDVMIFTSPNEYGSMYKKEWFSSVFTVGILYDLIPLLFPEQCLFDKVYTADYMESLEFLKSLDLILAISESAKNDAVKLLNIPEERIKVIYAGIDKDFKKLSKVSLEKLKSKYNIIDFFILFAGGVDFKKNIEGLIRAYADLGKSLTNRYQLVIVGNLSQNLIDRFLNIAKQYNLEGRVLCVGFVPKEDLIELYNVAEMLVFPSLYEGFGLPVIEAMACGTRIVTSNCSSLKEIAEGHAVLVNPRSTKSITKGILKIIDNPIESFDVAEQSTEYALSFTWNKVAGSAVNFIKNYYTSYPKNRDYNFIIDDILLKNIAGLFVEQGCNITPEILNRISEEMLSIQDQSSLPLLKGNIRILYDVTVVLEWLKSKYNTGIGRVCVELYKELSRIVNVVPISMKSNKGKVIIYRVSMNDYSIINQEVFSAKGDIYFMPELHLRGIQVSKTYPYAKYFREQGLKCYAVLYDLLPLQYPQYFEKKTVDEYHNYLVELAENYDGILSDSKAVSDDFIRYFRKEMKLSLGHQLNVGYFHLGFNSFNSTKKASGNTTLRNFFDESPVFYMLGTIEPRKGHEIVLQAFETMWQQGKEYKLCIIGHMGWNMNIFIDKVKKHREIGARLLFLEAASDDEVAFAYQHSTALIQASAGEGFGLPLIEAGNYDLPIICSNISVFHEVTEDNALFFDRDNEQSLIEAIEICVMNMKNGEVPSSKRIKGKLWCEVAKRVYGIIVNDVDWYEKIE